MVDGGLGDMLSRVDWSLGGILSVVDGRSGRYVIQGIYKV